MAAPDRPARRTSPRGELRRRALIDAAAGLAQEQGFAAVSHRAVASRAGLPLAATTYYFASLEDLLTETLQQLAQDWLDAAREAVARLPATLHGPDAVADAVLEAVALSAATSTTGPPEPAAVATLYERYLEAARSPHLRPAIAALNDGVQALLAEVLRRGRLSATPADARLVLAVADGALLRAIAEGAPLHAAAADVRELLARLA